MNLLGRLHRLPQVIIWFLDGKIRSLSALLRLLFVASRQRSLCQHICIIILILDPIAILDHALIILMLSTCLLTIHSIRVSTLKYRCSVLIRHQRPRKHRVIIVLIFQVCFEGDVSLGT